MTYNFIKAYAALMTTQCCHSTFHSHMRQGHYNDIKIFLDYIR